MPVDAGRIALITDYRVVRAVQNVDHMYVLTDSTDLDFVMDDARAEGFVFARLEFVWVKRLAERVDNEARAKAVEVIRDSTCRKCGRQHLDALLDAHWYNESGVFSPIGNPAFVLRFSAPEAVRSWELRKVNVKSLLLWPYDDPDGAIKELAKRIGKLWPKHEVTVLGRGTES